MKDYNRIREVIGIAFMFGSVIVAVIASIVSTVMRYDNPDMTEIRFIIEHPWTWKVSIGCVISYLVGWHLLKQ